MLLCFLKNGNSYILDIPEEGYVKEGLMGNAGHSIYDTNL